MFGVGNVSLHFGDRPIFDGISFQVNDQDRIGLVGRNGAGKSTLLKLMAGLIKPQEGDVASSSGYTIGYLPQEIDHHSDQSVIQAVAEARQEEQRLLSRIAEIQSAFDAGVDDMDKMAELLDEFNLLNERYQLIGGQSSEELIERVLKGLGFSRQDFDRSLNEFSGGWKMRVELAKILVTSPDLLLLDEPTNHLDIESIEWLEGFLSNYNGSMVLISHDVAFLDAVTSRTIEIVNGKIRDYKASYSGFLEQREIIIEKQRQEARNQERTVRETEALINKFRAKSSKASFAQSLIKKLDRMERVVVDEDQHESLNLRFPEAPRPGKVVLRANGIGKQYGSKHLFGDVQLELERGEKVALIGKNGIGKTTLLRILVGDETPDDGDVNLGHQVQMGYFAQHQTTTLDENLTVFEVIDQEATGEMRTRIRSLLGAFLFSGDEVYKKVKVLSGGEKSRLALCRLMLKPYNLLIMDEPTNHLDIDSKDVLKQALQQFPGALLIVSHDRHFLQGLTDKLFEIESGGLKTHLKDIQTFLAEKNAANIANYERSAKTKAVNTASEKGKIVHGARRKELEKEVRRIKGQVEKLEGKITELEEKLAVLNRESAELDFSNQEAVRASFEEITSVKNALSHSEEEWAQAIEKLEQAEQQLSESQ